MNLKELCERYSVGASTVNKWMKDATFPKKAVKKDGRSNVFDTAKVDAWLKKRPIAKTGPRPRWLSVVGHKKAVAAA